MDAQTAQVNLLKADLSSSLAKTEACDQERNCFKSNGEMIEAEILKSDQRLIEMNLRVRLSRYALVFHQTRH